MGSGYELDLDADGEGFVSLPLDYGPAHLRAVQEVIGSDHEVASADEYTHRIGTKVYFQVRRRVARLQPVTQAKRLLVAASTGAMTWLVVKASSGTMQKFIEINQALQEVA